MAMRGQLNSFSVQEGQMSVTAPDQSITPSGQQATLLRHVGQMQGTEQFIQSSVFKSTDTLRGVQFVLAGEVTIEHTLGRQPVGYLLVRVRNRIATEPVSYTEVELTDKRLTLFTDNVATVDLLIF